MMRMQMAEAQHFYAFDLGCHVPANHLLRKIDRFPDMDEMRERLRPFDSHTGRPANDPERIVRMLLLGCAMDEYHAGQRRAKKGKLKAEHRGKCGKHQHYSRQVHRGPERRVEIGGRPV
jgi:hypothetical protein